jgi:N-acetyl-gamma-glutamyl-phosphate reductase
MTRAGIAGFRGYSGSELTALLERHPEVDPVLLEHRSDSVDRPRPLGHPAPRRAPLTPESVRAEKLSVVFLATPAEVSSEVTPGLLGAGARVIDLSGAYRLETPERYARWYAEPHHSPELLAEAAYGLPEFYRDRIRRARLIANPGCYPTAANLALRPLVEAGVIAPGSPVVVDAKSGVSGAGRKPSLKTMFCEVAGNFAAYAVLEHRHVPEILLHSLLAEDRLSFTAQLLPVDRGILETIYFTARGVASAADLLAIYQRRYAGEPFIGLYAPGSFPDLASVTRTNRCDLGVAFDPPSGRAVVVVAIDNLVKGAAGQAVQNMNLLLGYPETAGLLESFPAAAAR